MEFSIIIPIYNTQEEYLRQCINSIYAQNYDDFEVLLVDDGSTNGIGSLCDKYSADDSRFHTIHKTNGGVSSARNVGLQTAGGWWILFLDADDWWEPNLLKTLHSKFLDYNSDIFIFSYFHDCIDSSEPIRMGISDYSMTGGLELLQKLQVGLLDENHRFAKSYIGSVWMQCVRREIVLQHHLFFDTNLRMGEDCLWNMNYLQHVKSVTLLDIPFYHYRVYETSCYHSYNPDLPSQVEYIDRALYNFGTIWNKGEEFFAAYESWLMKKYIYLLKMYFLHPKCSKTYYEKQQEWKQLFKVCPSLLALNSANWLVLVKGRKLYAPLWFFRFRCPSYFITQKLSYLFTRMGKI